MTSPSVSVIIPTWNRAHTLVAAVDSALRQPEVLEVLVCDDGSTDESRARVEHMPSSRVRWLDGAHTGRPAAARNRGLAHSRGEWLAFLDSDDEWLPGKLSRQLALARRLGCRAACGNALRVMPGESATRPLLDFGGPRLTFATLLRENLVICSTAVFHRSVLQRVQGFPEQRELVAAEDYALWLRVASLSDFAFVAEPVARYRDAPAESVRGQAPLADQQRIARVFASYLAWAPPSSRNALRVRLVQLRRALRALSRR